MKKKLSVIVIAFCMSIIVVACGKMEDVGKNELNVTETPVEKREQEEPVNEKVATGELGQLQTPVYNIITGFQEEYTSVVEYMGDSYDGYVEHKEEMNTFCEEMVVESQDVFLSLAEASVDYFEKAFDEHKDDKDALEDAIDDYYDEIYDGVLDDYYDDVYDGLLGDMYDDIYDGIISDSYEKLEYKEWSDASSEAYEMWSDTGSGVYKAWSNAGSLCYAIWSEASSQFYVDNKDAEDVAQKLKEVMEEKIQEIQDENKEDEKEVTEESQDDKTESSEASEEENAVSSENADDELIDGMRPEFKAAMDSYEEFFDEYIAFMEKYAESSGTLSMMQDYLDYMEKYAEAMEKLEEMEDDEMNEKEAAYYIEVMTRINQKLLEASL